MATDTKVTELVLNELTEEKLKELKDAGTVPPNEIFFTDDDETSPRGLPLGTIIPAAVISDDASLHLLDGSSLIQNGIYKQFCDWLKARVLANSSSVPTCTIAEYANEMSTYGQCGKFVINDTSEVQTSNGYRIEANSIKLPTITEFIASNNGGDTIGLAELDTFKSHTHPIEVVVLNNTTATPQYGPWFEGRKAYSWSSQGNGVGMSATGEEETRPKNIRYPYYIVVATAVKTDVEVDIDNVASDINAINSTLNEIQRLKFVAGVWVPGTYTTSGWGTKQLGISPAYNKATDIFSTDGNSITVKKSGYYEIFGIVMVQETITGSLKIVKNGTSLTNNWAYVNGYGTLVGHIITYLNANDDVYFDLYGESGGQVDFIVPNTLGQAGLEGWSIKYLGE